MRVTLKSGVSPEWLTSMIVGGILYQEVLVSGDFSMSDTKKWSESGVAYFHDCRRNSLLGSAREILV